MLNCPNREGDNDAQVNAWPDDGRRPGVHRRSARAGVGSQITIHQVNKTNGDVKLTVVYTIPREGVDISSAFFFNLGRQYRTAELRIDRPNRPPPKCLRPVPLARPGASSSSRP